MYRYADEKAGLFTDEGQRRFLKVRDWVQKALNQTGAFQLEALMPHWGSGSQWLGVACVDRLVELGEICELERPERPELPGQYRVFVKGDR